MRRYRLAALLISVLHASLSVCAQAPTSGLDAPQLFEKGMNALEGSNATRSGPNANSYFRRSAELGFAPAQVVLGYLYETGHTTTVDIQEAFEWYKKAARQDDPLAQWQVGRLIYSGLVSTRDLNEARTWLEKSAGHNDPFAEYTLGKIALERGDYSQAAQRFRQAAQQGLPQAQRQLALLLRAGQGVPQDKVEAYVWMLASYDAGLHTVTTDLHALEAELAGTQVEQAKTSARKVETSVARKVVAHGCTGWQGEFDEIPAPPPPDLQRFCR